MKLYKYPKTPHLPWSSGIHRDDRILSDAKHFEGKEVVVTEKMDGENTTMYRDYIHARSLGNMYHDSQSWIKNYWGGIRFQIPENYRICGENLTARHSIPYSEIEWWQVFSIWEGDLCLCWYDTLAILDTLEMETTPVLYHGVFDEELLRNLVSEMNFEKQEGYVIRTADSFLYENFNVSVAKFVRPRHVQTDEHWSKRWVYNK